MSSTGDCDCGLVGHIYIQFSFKVAANVMILPAMIDFTCIWWVLFPNAGYNTVIKLRYMTILVMH